MRQAQVTNELLPYQTLCDRVLISSRNLVWGVLGGVDEKLNACDPFVPVSAVVTTFIQTTCS